MNRYIDVDKLGIGRANPDAFENKDYVDGWNSAISILEKADVEDVVEIRQGKWKIEEYKNYLNVVCSNCNKEFYVYKQGQYRIDRSNYCPNCGAKMDRERKDEE